MKETDTSHKPITQERRRRINRIKKIILWMIVVCILVPVGISVVLGIQVNRMQSELDALKSEHTPEIAEETQDTVRDKVPESDKPMQIAGADELGAHEMDVAADANQGTYFLDAAVEDTYATWEEAQEALNADTVQEVELSYEDQHPDTIGGEGLGDGIRRVYLTFDDGPSVNTEAILEILDTYDVKATFFVCGKTDEHSISMYKEILKRGHTLGMHSYTHDYSQIYASQEAFSEDLNRIYALLYGVTGVKPFVYRFPGGSSNRVSKIDIHQCIDVLKDRDIVYYDWNSQTGDASKSVIPPNMLVTNALLHAEQYENLVILMHDAAARDNTVEALPKLIEKLMEMPDTVFLPITRESVPVQHVKADNHEH